MKLLGLSASLRNSRYGKGSEMLVKELHQIHSRKHLREYINSQSQACLSLFIESGRKENKVFNGIYRNYKKKSGTVGLSNSEAVLAAALWAVKQNGVEIEHVSLSEYLGVKKATNVSSKLIEKVKASDGFIISTPVYFGDRSSLSHDFFQIMRLHPEIVKEKLYAGITVGAKRNGGQETCLIYQMLDFLNIGLLAVGNDSETTAQYGGTGHAGDVGTIAGDEYGINTSIGTGNRIAQVIKLMNYSRKAKLLDKPKIGIIILQDKMKSAHKFIKKYILSSSLANKADFRFFYLVDENVRRCLACNICPGEIGDDKKYRCIIKSKNDLFVKHHKDLIDLDAILIGGYSPRSFDHFTSIYQTFIERTRYLRRGDYVYSNLLVAPFLIKELDNRENLDIRILTSMIRHHTIMYAPIFFYTGNGKHANLDSSMKTLDGFIDLAGKVTVGRLYNYSKAQEYSNYNPVGYTLSSAKDMETKSISKRVSAMNSRVRKYNKMLKDRVGHLEDKQPD